MNPETVERVQQDLQDLIEEYTRLAGLERKMYDKLVQLENDTTIPKRNEYIEVLCWALGFLVRD